MRRLDAAQPDFAAAFAALRAAGERPDPQVEAQVAEILAQVRRDGDAALLAYTARLDGHAAPDVAALEVPVAQLDAALAGLAPALREALEAAAARVRAYHAHQRPASWSFATPGGGALGQRVAPLDRVGVYVPGGRAAYPSTVLMNVIPARVAGVREVVMVSPAPGGAGNPAVLAAARIAGVDRVWRVGGAQAIAALAYGTASVARVDKIVGPGNRYVAAAKRQVYGEVGIDMVAGPSEVVIVADASAPAHWLALDLCAQAEHDEAARALLLSPDSAVLDAVARELEAIVPTLERRAIVEAALAAHGALVRTRDIPHALALAADLAPEHLGLAVHDAQRWLDHAGPAGAIFLGHRASEVLGDYCAGPNHVLPTGGGARFGAPLGVYDFVRRSSVMCLGVADARELAGVAGTLARAEGLTAHARAAAARLDEAPPQ
jgi:histidinol dehydrogenase